MAVDRLDGLSRVLHSERSHSHRFFTVLYVHRGTGSILSGRKTIPVGPGRVVVTAPGEMHDTRGMRGVDRWVVSFTPDAGSAGTAADALAAAAPVDIVWIRGGMLRHR